MATNELLKCTSWHGKLLQGEGQPEEVDPGDLRETGGGGVGRGHFKFTKVRQTNNFIGIYRINVMYLVKSGFSRHQILPGRWKIPVEYEYLLLLFYFRFLKEGGVPDHYFIFNKSIPCNNFVKTWVMSQEFGLWYPFYMSDALDLIFFYFSLLAIKNTCIFSHFRST